MTPPRTWVTSPRQRVVRAAASGVGLVLVVAGIPALLTEVADVAVPHGRLSWPAVRTALLTADDGHLALAALSWLAWTTWALLTTVIAVEASARLRGVTAPRIPGLGPVQTLARLLVTGVATLAVAAPSLMPRTPGPPPARAAVATATSRPAATPAAEKHARAHARWYTVRTHDTLWGIAVRELGDGHRYTEIADLNYGRRQPDGGQLTSDHWIHPGWRLLLPADAMASRRRGDGRCYVVQPGDTLRGLAARLLGDPGRYTEIAHLNRHRTQPDGRRLSDPDVIHPGWRLLIPTHHSTQHTANRPEHRDKPAARDPGRRHRPGATPTSRRPSPQATAGPTQTPHIGHRGVVALPSGASVGITLAMAIAAAVALGRLRRRRRYRPGTTPPLDPSPGPATRHLRRAATNCGDPDASDVRCDRVMTPTAEGTPVGARDGREFPLPLSVTGGLGLTGPGAAGVARAMLTTLLATGTHVVVPEQDLRRLLDQGDSGSDLLPTAASLTVTATLDAALQHLDAERIARARHDTGDAPPDPPADVVLLASVPEPARRRLTAIVDDSHHQRITAVVLGAWPHGTTCHLDDEGTVTHATGAVSDQLDASRLFHLTPADAVDVLATLAHTDGTVTDHPDQTPPAAPTNAHPPGRPTSDHAVRLSVFGAVRLFVDDTEVATGLRSSARELLAYLAAHPDGVTLDHAVTALWPDTDPDRAAVTFRAAVGNIRKTLRDTSGARSAAYVTYTAGRYRLDPQTVDVDLWQFHRHLAQAGAKAGEDAVAALTTATATYTADFADTHAYEWAEPVRESLHRTAVDTFTRLADLHHDTGETEHAVAVLDCALELDPYNEDLYQRAIRLHAELGRADAIAGLYRLLRTRLADLDVEPDPATDDLVRAHLTDATIAAAHA